jgi:nitroimidazol reductase NimA-like FMN-containing flavoprotein (pyridoxamine 5'-phosphate oxidase superfamily)
VGRVAFVDAGEPVVLPVNHAVSGRRVVFRTARGALLHEALMDRPVAFEVDDFDAGRRTGWSVLVRGRATLADDTDELDALGLDAWADAVERDDWVTIVADEVTGRRIADR